MDIHHCSRKTSGFTLLELMIVVVIISVLSAVVVPAFNLQRGASAQSFLAANQKIVQEAIDRYSAEHGNYPRASTPRTTCPLLSTATIQPARMRNFVNRLLMHSDVNGAVCNDRSKGLYPLGPYLKKTIPTNPLCDFEMIYVYSNADTPPRKNTRYGWAYNYDSGEFLALGPAQGCSDASGGGGGISPPLLALLLLQCLATAIRKRTSQTRQGA